MLALLDTIISFFTTIFTLIGNMLANIVLVFEMLLNAIVLPAQLAVLMPSFIGTAVLIAVSVWVVKTILGVFL